jgi:hypothetical protein
MLSLPWRMILPFYGVPLLADPPRLGRPGRNAGTGEVIIPRTCSVVAYRVTDRTVDVLASFTADRTDRARFDRDEPAPAGSLVVGLFTSMLPPRGSRAQRHDPVTAG